METKEYTIKINGAYCCNDCDDMEFNVEDIISEFAQHGFNVTEEAIMHNYNAWTSDYKSGYLDKENGYFLFSACGCNQLYFLAEELNGKDYQETYIA